MAHLGDLAISPSCFCKDNSFTLNTTPSISNGIFSLEVSMRLKYSRHSSMEPTNSLRLLTGNPHEEKTENISCKLLNSIPWHDPMP